MTKVKVFTVILMMLVLVFPARAYGLTVNADGVATLNFDQIEEEILDNNPTAVANQDSLSDARSSLQAAKGALEGLIATYTKANSDIGSLLGTDSTTDTIITEVQNLNGAQIKSLQTQVDAIDKQLKDSWKAHLQVDMGNDLLVWGAENMFMGYHSLSRNLDGLNDKLHLAEQQLSIAKLQQSLGMVTAVDLKAAELQLGELTQAIKLLTEQRDSLKQQLNVMLGRDFDVPLSLGPDPSPDVNKINAMDLSADSAQAVNMSFKVRLQTDDDTRYDDEARKFVQAFNTAYQTVKDKQTVLEQETERLNQENMKFSFAQLRYDLGMISKIEFKSAQAVYRAQELKVDSANQDLFKAYTAYEWMMKGLTLS